MQDKLQELANVLDNAITKLNEIKDTTSEIEKEVLIHCGTLDKMATKIGKIEERLNSFKEPEPKYIDFFEAMQAIKNGHTVMNDQSLSIVYFLYRNNIISTPLGRRREYGYTFFSFTELNPTTKWWIVE